MTHAISPTNLTKWRQHPQHADWYAYILVPTVIYTASVNMSSFTYPVQTLVFDGGTGNLDDIRAGMTLRVKSSTGVYKGIVRIASLPSSPNMYIAQTSQGDIDFADNDILEVLNEFRLWTRIPRIDPLSGIQYKDGNIGFSAESAQPPVAGFQSWYIKKVDPDTGLITVDFDGTMSYAIAAGATITSYTWDVMGGTITVGTTSDDQIAATFEAGVYWVSLTVTDSNGIQHTTYRLVVGVDDETNPPLRASIARLNYNQNGYWEAGIDIYEADASAYPDGAAILIWAENERYGDDYGALNGETGREHVKFTGWLTSDRNVISYNISDFAFTAVGNLGIISKLDAFPHTLIRAAAPSNWSEVANFGWWRQLHHTLFWHSTVLELCYLNRPSFHNDYPLPGIETAGQKLLEQCDYVTQAVRAMITCDRHGGIFVHRNIQLMSTAERTAAGSIVSLEDSDWAEDIIYDRIHQQPLDIVWFYGQVASETDITAVKTVAPGVAPGQGENQETLNNQIVLSQDDADTLVMRYYRWKNSPDKPFGITVFKMGMIADPAWGEPVKFTLDPSLSRNRIEFDEDLFVLLGMSVRYDGKKGTTLENWEVQRAIPVTTIKGTPIVIPGATPPDEGVYIDNFGTLLDQTPPPYEYTIPEGNVPYYVPSTVTSPPVPDQQYALAWKNPLYYADNVGESSPTYISMFTPVGETVQSVVHAFISPFISNNANDLLLYALTNAGLYFAEGVIGTTPTLKQSLTNYTLLRHVQGITGGAGIAAWKSEVSNPSTYSDDFAAGLGAKSKWTSSSLPLGFRTATAQEGAWSATGGRTNAGCLVGTASGIRNVITIVVDLGYETTVTGCSFYKKADTAGQVWGRVGRYFDSEFNELGVPINTSSGSSSTSYSSESGSLTTNNVRYVALTIEMNSPYVPYMDEISVSYEGGVIRIAFSDDSGATIHHVTMGGIGGQGYDTDDFNLGIHISASNYGIAYTTAYDNETGTQLAGLTGVNGATEVSIVRVPYRKILTQELNNDATSLQFIYGTESAVSGKTLWAVTFDTTTGTIIAQVDITPIISGTTYCVVGDEALETSGVNTQKVFAAVQPTGGGTKQLIRTLDGGGSWSKVGNNLDFTFVRWEQDSQVNCSFAGSGGMKITKNTGSSLLNRIGDFSGSPIGFYTFPVP